MYISKLLFYLYSYKNRYLRKLILRIAIKLEGGQLFSKTLRHIYSHYHNIAIGMYSYGGCFSLQNIPPGTKIGRYCSFARDVFILNGNHPLNFKSLHPFFYNPELGFVKELLITRTNQTIDNDVWIGQNAIILPSVTNIGSGAVIGAGSVVVENVPPFAIVAGNPARLIRYRFTHEKIDEIIQSAWWNKDIHELETDISEFMNFLNPIE